MMSMPSKPPRPGGATAMTVLAAKSWAGREHARARPANRNVGRATASMFTSAAGGAATMPRDAYFILPAATMDGGCRKLLARLAAALRARRCRIGQLVGGAEVFLARLTLIVVRRHDDTPDKRQEGLLEVSCYRNGRGFRQPPRGRTDHRADSRIESRCLRRFRWRQPLRRRPARIPEPARSRRFGLVPA